MLARTRRIFVAAGSTIAVVAMLVGMPASLARAHPRRTELRRTLPPATVPESARARYLVRLLHESPALRVRAQAALSLGHDPDPAVVTALATAARTDIEPPVRAAALHSLGRIGDPAAMPAVRDALQDPSPEVRAAAAGAMRAVPHSP